MSTLFTGNLRNVICRPNPANQSKTLKFLPRKSTLSLLDTL